MRKLVMSPSEIVSSFRQAKRPNDQIGVLADLNDCTKQDILDVLTEEGAISGVTPPR